MSRTTSLRRVARGAVVLTTGAAVALTPIAFSTSTATAAAASKKGCSTGSLPANIKGKPAAFKAGLPAGAWVWQDAKGWHLRVTHDDKKQLNFTGTVRSSGKITAKRYAAERNDVLWRSSKKNAIKFTLRNYGRVDGIDFKVGCAAKVTFSLSSNRPKVKGTKLATSQIKLGKNQANPTTNPFSVNRIPVGCSTGALPATVKGAPTGFKAGLPAGAWVWQDSKGWHLRVTQAAKTKLTFSGTISSSHKISAKRIRAEKNDVLWRNNSNTAVRFTLQNYGGVDGLDFRVGCADKVTFTLNSGSPSARLTTAQIHLGKNGVSPTSNPFVVDRS